MGKSSGSPPPAPDPNAVARAQTRLNQDTAQYNAALNRINTNTPLGSQQFSISGYDPRTGAPIYEQDITLDPQIEQAFRQQIGQDIDLRGYGSDLISQARTATSQPFSFSGLPERGSLNAGRLPALPTDMNALRQSSQDALYARNAEYLDPQFERGEEALRSRLANQGIVEGSEAFSNAMDDFNRGKETAYRQARNEAIAGGGEEAERTFGMSSAARGQLFGEDLAGANFDNLARQQALSEALTGRQLPLQELATIRGMTNPTEIPQFPAPATVGTSPADIAGAMQNQYQGQLDAYNARTQGSNALMSGLFSLGSAWLMSDERVKDDIQEIGELNDGTNLYAFRYKGDDTPQVGVMAQEVEKRDPKAVREFGGIKHVDYSRVMARALEAA